MINLRIVAPTDVAPIVVASLGAQVGVTNVAYLPGASAKPPGDLIFCDVAAEATNYVLEALREFDLEARGSITISRVEFVLSQAARQAEREAPGSPANAVVWETVEGLTGESARLSASFLAFMVLASLIAAGGILTDSLVLIIGAMVVGPEFGPLAGLCVSTVERRPLAALRSLSALAVGFPVAVLTSCVVGLMLRGTDAAPDALHGQGSTATLFISHPNTWTVIVALAAAVAGMLSLTSAKSGALIGVLISLTTIPAASNIGLALAYADSDEFWGSLQQLLLNLACIIVAGLATLLFLKFVIRRNRLGFLSARARLASWQRGAQRRRPTEDD